MPEAVELIGEVLLVDGNENNPHIHHEINGTDLFSLLEQFEGIVIKLEIKQQ